MITSKESIYFKINFEKIFEFNNVYSCVDYVRVDNSTIIIYIYNILRKIKWKKTKLCRTQHYYSVLL